MVRLRGGFAISPAMPRAPVVSVILPIPAVFFVFDDGHPNKYEVASHCGFDLHIPNDE